MDREVLQESDGFSDTEPEPDSEADNVWLESAPGDVEAFAAMMQKNMTDHLAQESQKVRRKYNTTGTSTKRQTLNSQRQRDAKATASLRSAGYPDIRRLFARVEQPAAHEAAAVIEIEDSDSDIEILGGFALTQDLSVDKTAAGSIASDLPSPFASAPSNTSAEDTEMRDWNVQRLSTGGDPRGPAAPAFARTELGAQHEVLVDSEAGE